MLALTLTIAMATANVVKLAPKTSLAGVSLGQKESELAALGLKARTDMAGWYERKAAGARWAELSVRVEGGKVTDIEIGLAPDDVVDWGAGPSKPKESYTDLAARFGKCGPVAHNIGGNWIQCDDGVAFVETIAGRGIRLQASPKAKQASCTDYLEGAGQRDVAAGRTYCLGALVLTAKTTLGEVEAMKPLGFCETVKQGGGATRRCRGTHLLFTPAGTLSRVEIAAPAAPTPSK